MVVIVPGLRYDTMRRGTFIAPPLSQVVNSTVSPNASAADYEVIRKTPSNLSSTDIVYSQPGVHDVCVETWGGVTGE